MFASKEGELLIGVLVRDMVLFEGTMLILAKTGSQKATVYFSGVPYFDIRSDEGTLQGIGVLCGSL